MYLSDDTCEGATSYLSYISRKSLRTGEPELREDTGVFDSFVFDRSIVCSFFDFGRERHCPDNCIIELLDNKNRALIFLIFSILFVSDIETETTPPDLSFVYYSYILIFEFFFQYIPVIKIFYHRLMY